MSLNKRQFLVLVLLFPLLLKAQVNTSENSPYSAYGIGDIRPFGSIRNLGMGGTGLAFANSQYLNFQNPALLSRTEIIYHTASGNETISSIAKAYSISEEELRQVNNLSDEVKEGQKIRIPVRKYTIWETGINGTLRWINSPADNYASSALGFQYFLIGIPISQRLYTTVGLSPHSIAGSNTSIEAPLDPQTNIITTNKTDGGTNQAFLSAGYDVTNNLSIGLHMGYLFGKISRDYSLMTRDITGYEDTTRAILQENSYSALLLKPGIFYRSQINKGSGDSAVFLNAGFTADFTAAGSVLSESHFQKRIAYNAISLDTLISRNRSNHHLPVTLGFGLALHKANNWTIGADFNYGLWEGYTSPDSSVSYTNSFRVSLGGEWKFGEKGEASFKKPTYRAGIAYQTLPYQISGSTISDISLSLGASYPIGRINMADKNQPLTKINLAATVGQQGETSLSTGREIYFKAHVGILINDKWFRRRRIQ